MSVSPSTQLSAKETTVKTTCYHVCRGEWDGKDLLPLVRRVQWSDETAEMIATNWPECDPWEYYCREAHFVHLHDSLEQAREFVEEFGGQVLAVDVEGLELQVGDEYPHPVFGDRIEASRISVV